MDTKEKLRLLKSLRLLEHIPSDKLSALADFLEPQSHADGDVVFEEGSKGNSMFFVSSGRIRILKRVIQADGTPAFKDIAVLQAGDCFGEMALFDDQAPRSARAAASGETVLFRLESQALRRWLESNPALAVGFFSELVQVLSRRLRRSSNELTLLFDLSQWLLEPIATGKELLQKVLRHLVPHLEGTWTAGAYLYNEYNAEMELVATEGDFKAVAAKLPPQAKEQANPWLDPHTYLVSFPGKKHMQGYLTFHTPSTLTGEEMGEISRTLTTTAHLIASALENINFRTENAMRARLEESRSYAKGL